MSKILIPLLVMTPLVFAIFSFVFKKLSKHLGILFAFLWFVLAVLFFILTNSTHQHEHYIFGGFASPLGISFYTSSLSSLMILFSSFLILVVSIYAFFYLKPRDGLFYPLVGFLSTGIGVLFLSTDIFNLYVALEIIGISSVALSALGAKKESIKSAIEYLFASLLGSGLYLFGVGVLYGIYGTLYIEQLSSSIQYDFSTNVSIVLMIVGLCLKTALFPFHYWLPKAHANALSPVSALLSAIVVKSSFYLLFVLWFQVFGATIDIFGILAYFGVVAIVYGAIQAIRAKEFKQLIAYSTVSQLGYLFIIFGLDFSMYSLNGAFFALFSHMLAKGGLFLASGVIIMTIGSKNIIDLRGVAYVLPFSVFAIALSSVSLIGLPPSLGFISKWNYLIATFENDMYLLFIAIAFGSILSAIYLFKILILTLSSSVAIISVPQTNQFRILQWCAFVLSLLSVFLGFFSSYIAQAIGV